jgi:hypothetical protein
LKHVGDAGGDVDPGFAVVGIAQSVLKTLIATIVLFLCRNMLKVRLA